MITHQKALKYQPEKNARKILVGKREGNT